MLGPGCPPGFMICRRHPVGIVPGSGPGAIGPATQLARRQRRTGCKEGRGNLPLKRFTVVEKRGHTTSSSTSESN